MNPTYTSYGTGIGILETRVVRSFKGGRFIARPVRLLVLDPAKADWNAWLIWQSIKAAQRVQQCQ